MILLTSECLNEGNEIICEDGNIPEVIDKGRPFTEGLNRDARQLLREEKDHISTKGFFIPHRISRRES